MIGRWTALAPMAIMWVKHHTDSRKKSQFVKEDFDRYDKIYALADDVLDEIKRIARNKYNPEKVDLLLNELYPGENLSVPDPWYGPEPGYHEVYKLIDEACKKIIAKYANVQMNNMSTN